jgi:hypothetical protein
VNGSEEKIADALRAMAEQARMPAVAADAAWRSGRRRVRLTAMAMAGAAAIVVAAVVVPLSGVATGGSAPSARTAPGARPSVTIATEHSPVSLGSPIEMRQISRVGNLPCGVGGVPGVNGPGGPSRCYYLTGSPFIIREVESIRITVGPPGDYTIAGTLRRADAGLFAALTGKLARLPMPRSELAVVIGGRVVGAPTVEASITGGQFQIAAGSRAQAEDLLHTLLAG